MWLAFKEVLVDLWLFTRGKQTPALKVQALLVQRVPVPQSTPNDLLIPAAQPIVGSRRAYITAHDVPCLREPIKKFDSVIEKLQYGQEVHVDVVQPPYIHTYSEKCTGWVKQSDVTEDFKQIEPEFTPQAVYDAKHVEVNKLRRFIADQQSGGALNLPLQSSEYVLFKLQAHKQPIDWPKSQPRLPGLWQIILKEKNSVTIGVTPKTGSIIEGVFEGINFLGFVEIVLPNSTIRVSSVGRRVVGEYLEEELTHAQWGLFQPVFISFN